MTKQQFLDTHFNFSENLDLEVEIANNEFVRTFAKFKSLTINEERTQIFIGIEHCVVEKYGRQFTLPPMPQTLGTSGTEVAVLNADLTPLLDDNNEPITVPESLYWKKLAWENPMPIAFKSAIENAIKLYYGFPATPLAFVLPA